MYLLCAVCYVAHLSEKIKTDCANVCVYGSDVLPTSPSRVGGRLAACVAAPLLSLLSPVSCSLYILKDIVDILSFPSSRIELQHWFKRKLLLINTEIL